MKTKHNKKTKFFTKKNILLIVVGGSVLLGLAFLFTFDENMSASVSKLSQTSRSFITKPKEILPTVCIDSDDGINYTTKGTIFLSGGINRMEEDTCNTNGTLREWFCGQSGDAAGLLRSQNYVNCEYGCNDGACTITPITGNIIKDIAIDSAYFIASNNHEAMISITVKNIGNTVMPIAGLGHNLYLDGISTLMTDNYTMEFFTNPSLSALQPNTIYTISAAITLDEDLSFSYSDTLHVEVPAYPEVDDNIENNMQLLYITGNILPL